MRKLPMNPEQQRIAIAEACGWFFMDDSWHYPNGAKALSLPDYLTDLNAMHEAEKMLNRESGYHEIGGYGLYLVALEHNVSSTAAQRAEAFLKTLNLWKP
jgi:hypothetical protein